MDDFMTKPVRFDQLVAMLEKWVPSGKSSQPDAAGSVNPAPPSKPAKQSLNSALDVGLITTLKQLGGEDNREFLANLSVQFFKDADGQVSRIREAIATGDASGLEHTAHTLKSSCSAIGALDMRKLCSELPTLGHGGSVDGTGDLVERLTGEYDRVRSALELEVSKIQESGKPGELL